MHVGLRHSAEVRAGKKESHRGMSRFLESSGKPKGFQPQTTEGTEGITQEILL